MGDTPMAPRARAFTLVELLVIITIISILMAIILPSIAGAQRSAREARERKQLVDINTAWKTWASSHRNSYPIPGLVRRRPIDTDGDGIGDVYTTGSGRENAKWNDHASVLSLCIMENLLMPNQVISPNEYNNNVYEYTNYRYEELGSEAEYGDSKETDRWDPHFSNDLTDEFPGYGYCHNSYAIMPLAGERRLNQWDRPGDSSFAVLGTRGPLEGDASLLNAVDADGNAQTPSNTAFLMAQAGAWRGILVYADGHSDITEGFYPEGSTYEFTSEGQPPEHRPDNIFKADVEPQTPFLSDTPELLGHDILLTHTILDPSNPTDDWWRSDSDMNPFDITFRPIHD
jgi:hypothetical protein